ncbi:MAG: RNA polymerase sigma factor [Solirubrobacteraceae bacterium]
MYDAVILARCVEILRDQTRAEDVAQQVVLEACRDLDRFERRSSLHTWLRRIAKHRCLDELKKRRSAAKYVETEGDVVVDAADGGPGPEARLDDAKLRAALEECLQELPAATAETVRLRFQDEDLSYEEMALVMNTQASTLNQRVIRALKALEECLARKGWARG